MAMPAVKPVTTECGTSRTARPSRKIPMKRRRKAASVVASIKPPGLCSATTGARITTKAAVGPATCTREPPVSAMTPPATIAVTSP